MVFCLFALDDDRHKIYRIDVGFDAQLQPGFCRFVRKCTM